MICEFSASPFALDRLSGTLNNGASTSDDVTGHTVMLACVSLKRSDCTTTAGRGLPWSPDATTSTTSPRFRLNAALSIRHHPRAGPRHQPGSPRTTGGGPPRRCCPGSGGSPRGRDRSWVGRWRGPATTAKQVALVHSRISDVQRPLMELIVNGYCHSHARPGYHRICCIAASIKVTVKRNHPQRWHAVASGWLWGEGYRGLQRFFLAERRYRVVVLL